MRIVAIDPGLHACGLALFEDGRLKKACLVREQEEVDASVRMAQAMEEAVEGFASTLDILAVEVPRVYVRGKGDPQDLIDLAFVAGSIVGVLGCYFKSIVTVKPRSWKGNVEKSAMTERIKTRWMLVAEHDAVDLTGVKKTENHNVFDAIGLGIWFMKANGLRKSMVIDIISTLKTAGKRSTQ